jgi:hypothetical protein
MGAFSSYGLCVGLGVAVTTTSTFSWTGADVVGAELAQAASEPVISASAKRIETSFLIDIFLSSFFNEYRVNGKKHYWFKKEFIGFWGAPPFEET